MRPSSSFRVISAGNQWFAVYAGTACGQLNASNCLLFRRVPQAGLHELRRGERSEERTRDTPFSEGKINRAFLPGLRERLFPRHIDSRVVSATKGWKMIVGGKIFFFLLPSVTLLLPRRQ